MQIPHSVFAGGGTAAVLNGIEKRHASGTANVIWSPVPQVDVGMEYEWGERFVQSAAAAGGNTNKGVFNRVEGEMVFKF
jgi:hypothetical protein